MTPSLLLVEGLPGCGKSTTAQFLARQLELACRSVRWHYEQEANHPVFARPYSGSTWQGYFEDRLGRWAAFAAEVKAGTEVRILESALFQTPLLTLLRADVETDIILRYLALVQDVLRPLGPMVLYLRHPRPDEAVHRIGDHRGFRWVSGHVQQLDVSPFAVARRISGMPGLLAYWRDHAAMCERALTASPLRTLVVDVATGTWDERRQRMLDMLGVPWTKEPPTAPGYLDRFAGTYRGAGAGSRPCAIDVHAGGLRVNGLLWPDNPLLPRAENVFDLESWPLRAEFDEDGHGAITGMRLTGPDLQWSSLERAFIRL